MENINQMTHTLFMILNTQFMIQNTLFVTQNTPFVNQMTQNILFVNQMTQNTPFYDGDGQKTIIHVQGEHDPRSPQNWRISSDFWSPALITAI